MFYDYKIRSVINCCIYWIVLYSKQRDVIRTCECEVGTAVNDNLVCIYCYCTTMLSDICSPLYFLQCYFNHVLHSPLLHYYR